jgi:hypothetical protein
MSLESGYIIPTTGNHIDGPSRLIKSGTISTNQFGDFTINFNSPSEQGIIYIYFESGIPRHEHNYNQWGESEYDEDDGLVYEEDYDALFMTKGNLWRSDSIEIESAPLKVGGRTKVTVRTSQTLTNGDELFAKCMPGTPTSALYLDNTESDWVCWVEGGNCIFLENGDGDNEYEGHIVIPSFMSKDGDYTIVAGNIDSDAGYPYVNHVSLKEGESAGSGIIDPLMVMLLIGVIVAILLLLVVLAVKNRKKGGIRTMPEGAEYTKHPKENGEPGSVPHSNAQESSPTENPHQATDGMVQDSTFLGGDHNSPPPLQPPFPPPPPPPEME